MTKTTTTWWPVPLALLGLVLAGCGGSSSKSASPATSGSSASSVAGSASASSSAPVSGFASTSAGTPAGQLSKPDFLIEMNRICTSYSAKVKALPTPSGATDFAAIQANLGATLRLVPSFLSEATALVDQSAERGVLHKNWLAVESADFAAMKPLAQRMVAHAKARDAAKVQADANALSALPDHSKALTTYLAGFGLSSCAALESQ